ncbi:hypothetical protein Cantr_01143 [Candida viswanathii]|uniref:Uncharacterized protein n=1 Tax=Candida viswanathii TaxID=5486 RepID=A0A367YID1_9ASCO|nr:hypothetical protein Cantr_01143 [Candida viswanathii]
MKFFVWSTALLLYLSFVTGSTLDKAPDAAGVTRSNSATSPTHFVTTRWGRLALWGAYGFCSSWPANAIATTVEKYQERRNNRDIPWGDFAKAAMEAVARTFAYGMFGAAIVAAILDNHGGQGQGITWGQLMIMDVIWLATVVSLRLWTVLL